MKESTDTNKIPCTVAILTYNSGETLRRCLESVKDFEEIIICDGGSVDDTLSIAREFGCSIIEQDEKYKYDNNKIADFSGVRNQTIEAASYRWYLYVDSDEYLTPELVEEVREIASKPADFACAVFNMPRKYSLDDKLIECASTYPNYHTRLFNLDYVTGFIKTVHERINRKPDVQVCKLVNSSIVPLESDYENMAKKQAYYLGIEKQRKLRLTRSQLVSSLRGPLRVILVRLVKIVLARLLCRGTKLPFRNEFAGIRYQLGLVKIIVTTLFRRQEGNKIKI